MSWLTHIYAHGVIRTVITLRKLNAGRNAVVQNKSQRRTTSKRPSQRRAKNFSVGTIGYLRRFIGL